MKRSAGVTAAAVVALLGSVCISILGVSSLFGLIIASRKGIPETSLPQQGPNPLVSSMGLGILFDIGLATWVLLTAVGLLRLKPWSRISVLIFSGFLAVTGAFYALIFMILPLPESRGTPEISTSIFRISMELFGAAILVIAAWWFVLFTRKTVVAQFSEVLATVTVPGDPASGSIGPPAVMIPKLRRPLTITIIAWLYVVNAAMMVPVWLISGARSMPVPFFWTMLQGRGALIYYLLFSSAMLASGVGLLKNKAWAYWLTMGIQTFSLLKIAAVVLLPGREARWERFMESVSHSFPPESLDQFLRFLKTAMVISTAGGFIFALAVLWLLWSRRKRFLDFAAMHTISAPDAG